MGLGGVWSCPHPVHLGKLRPREKTSLPGLCPLPREVSLNIASSAVTGRPIQPREVSGLQLLRASVPPAPSLPLQLVSASIELPISVRSSGSKVTD